MPPATLFNYIAARTLVAVAALFAIFASLILLVDLIENMRFAGKFDGDFAFAARLTLLRTPGLAQALSPFVFLFGSIWMFTQLNRRSEVAVMRSAGLSVWRLIAPAAFVATIAGFLIITVIDPLSSRMLAVGEQMKNDIRGKQSSFVRVLGDGIWLRQKATNSVLIINASGFDEMRSALTDVIVWRLGNDLTFRERIDAPEAILAEQTIELRNARLKTTAERLDHTSPIYAIRTTLTADDLRQRVTPPETMSIWQLPKFILLAEAAGLPTVRYEIRFHDLCSTPLKLLAMVLIAAIFSLRPFRSGGASKLLFLSIGAGFLLYILSEMSAALGVSGTVPVALAAWTPALVAALVAITSLLQFEDG